MAGTVQISNPNYVVAGQMALTGTAQQLPAGLLNNGLVIKSKTGNTGSITVGADNTITTATDGSGRGYILAPGEAISFGCANANNVWVIGTAADVVTWAAN